MRVPNQPEAIRLGLLLGLVGVVTLLLGMAFSPARVWANALVSALLIGGVAVGSLALAAAEDAAGSAWSASFRQVPASLSRGLTVTTVLMALILLRHPTLYPWGRDAGASIAGTLPAWIQMVGRSAAYLALWLAGAFVLMPDRGQRPGPMPGSAVFLVACAATVWMAGSDWVVSLSAQWFSPVLGVFVAASFLVAAAASIALVAAVLKTCVLADRVTDRQIEGLGWLLLAAAGFWFYIWYCLYTSRHYTVIPDEMRWFATRLSGGWKLWFFFAPVLVAGVPALGLLSAPRQRYQGRLAAVSAVAVLGSWVNLYMLVVPSIDRSASLPSVWELGMVIGTLGVFVVLTALGLKRPEDACPIPVAPSQPA